MQKVMTAEKVRPAELSLKLGLDFTLLAAAYYRWQAEDLLPLIFHRCPGMTLEQFLDWCYQPTVEPVGVFSGGNLVGVGFIAQAYQINGENLAEVGACFFRGIPLATWRRGLRLLVRHAFVDRGFAKIYGLSWAHNRAAGLLTRSCGMQPADRLPWGEEVPADTSISVLDRMSWAGWRAA